MGRFWPDRDKAWVRDYISDLLADEKTWDQVINFKNRLVGYCGLCNISKQNKSAEFYILIGESDCWNLGVGTEAGNRVLKYGFDDLELNRIWLTVSSLNAGAIKSYLKLGFSEEGVMREASYRDGIFHDKVVMSVLRCEMHYKFLERTVSQLGV